jgi:RNA polymerase sigma-70 factor (ECF subfamily)
MTLLRIDPELLRIDPELLRTDPERLQVDPELLPIDPERLQVDPELLPIDPELLRTDPKLLQIDRELLRADPKLLEVDPERLQVDREQQRIDRDVLQDDRDLLRIDPERLQVNGDLLRVDPELLQVDRDLVRIDLDRLWTDPELLQVDRDLLRIDVDRLWPDPEQLHIDPEQLHIDPDLLHIDPDLLHVDPDLLFRGQQCVFIDFLHRGAPGIGAPARDASATLRRSGGILPSRKVVSMSERTESDDLGPQVPPAVLARRAQFLAFLERRLGRRDLAEEILQAAYLKAIEASGSIERDESAVAWFYRVLRNAVVDRGRRLAIEERALEGLANELAAEGASDEPLRGAVCRCVDGLIPTLKPEYAEIVRQVDLGGASVHEAAAELGVTANNASVRLHRARAALRKRLEHVCGACADHGCLDCTCGTTRV